MNHPVYAIDVFLLPHGRKMIGDVAGERGCTGSNSKSYRISAVASKRTLAYDRGVPSRRAAVYRRAQRVAGHVAGAWLSSGCMGPAVSALSHQRISVLAHRCVS